MAKLHDMKKQFLIDQAIINTIRGALQHGCVYEKGIKDKEKDDFRRTLVGEIKSLELSYKKKVLEEVHCKNIVGIADRLTEKFNDKGILRKKRFRVGIAQKALNLYLKYLWCLGEIPIPPHCPIDRYITDKLDFSRHERGEYDWTKIDDIKKYKMLIIQCRDMACGKSIAEWELEIYGNREL